MKNADDIKRIFENVVIETKPVQDEKILEKMTAAFNQTHKAQSERIEPNIWRIIMKSKITKLAAAAVIIFAGIFFGLNYFGRADNKPLNEVNVYFFSKPQVQANKSVVEGQVFGPNSEPIEGANVHLQVFVGGDVNDQNNYVYYDDVTDINGTYRFDKVESGSAQIMQWFTTEDGYTGCPMALNFPFRVGEAAKYNITLGGKGRPITGRFVVCDSNMQVDWSKFRTRLILKPGPIAMGWREIEGKFFRKLFKLEGGDFYNKREINVEPNGYFRIENVRAGKYLLQTIIPEYSSEGFFNLTKVIMVEPIPGGNTDVPIELGDIHVRLTGKNGG